MEVEEEVKEVLLRWRGELGKIWLGSLLGVERLLRLVGGVTREEEEREEEEREEEAAAAEEGEGERPPLERRRRWRR